MSTSLPIFVLLILCSVNVVNAQSNYLADVLSQKHSFRYVSESRRLDNLTDALWINSIRQAVVSLQNGLNGNLLQPLLVSKDLSKNTFTLSDALNVSLHCRRDLEIWLHGLTHFQPVQGWAFQS